MQDLIDATEINLYFLSPLGLFFPPLQAVSDKSSISASEQDDPLSISAM